MYKWIPLLCLLALACAPVVSEGEGEGEGEGESDSNESFRYMGDDVFLDVHMTMAAEDFAELRGQQRNIFTTLGPGCSDRSFPSPFAYFPADVSIDGVPGEETISFTNVGVRKKGFLGSVVPEKPSLKVKFNKYVADQRFFGEKRLTLNNQNQDPSLVRTCLAYYVFRGAGVPAPRCNFAQVTVNGERLGVYANVDAIKRPLLRRHFGEDEGNLYEGTLSDFRPGWTGTIEKKTNDIAVAMPEVDALVSALTVPDDELMRTLANVIDLDSFYTYWATETLVSHWDGYSGNTNNYFFYGRSDGLVEFIPWGTDGTFQPPLLLFENIAAPDSVMATGLLTRRLYQHPAGRAAYLARLDELMNSVWSEADLVGEIDRQVALFQDALTPEESVPVRSALADVKSFLNARRGRIEAEINNGPIDWDVPLRQDICLPHSGTVNFTFQTTWGTHPAPNFVYTAGTAEVSGDVQGQALAPTATASGAGTEVFGNFIGRAVIVVTTELPDDVTNYFYLIIKPELLVPGAVLNVDGNDVQGVHFVVFPQFAVRGGFYEGTLTLGEFSAVDGAPVSGSFAGKLTSFGGG